MSSSEDYVFRYGLELPGHEEDQAQQGDRLVGMLRTHLENMLNLILPTCEGKEVKIDGFKLLNDPTTIHPIFPCHSCEEKTFDETRS